MRARVAHGDTVQVYFRKAANCRIASNRSATSSTGTSPPYCSHLNLRVRYYTGAAMDGQQPSEYVGWAMSPCMKAYIQTGTRDFPIWPTARAIHGISRPRNHRRCCEAVPLHGQGRHLYLSAERPLLAPPRFDTMASDVCRPLGGRLKHVE
jgi:hypothetical protein